MKDRRSKPVCGVALLAAAMLIVPLCGCDAVESLADAAGAGILDLVQGSVSGVGAFTLFGENPPALIFNSILNVVGGGAAGGAHG